MPVHIEGLIAADNTRWFENAIRDIRTHGSGVIWWNQMPSGSWSEIETLEGLRNRLKTNGNFDFYFVQHSVAVYKATIVDFAIEEDYDAQKWRREYAGIDVYDSFEDYEDDSLGDRSNARIVFVAVELDLLTNTIPVDQFIFPEPLSRPIRRNLQPYITTTMDKILQTFTIHPVGQGLFYSGQLRLVNNTTLSYFNFVFDCGSLTRDAGEAQVDAYVAQEGLNNNAPIDLLIISHFDADHVNQIGRLLAGQRKVKKLVMPFLGFEERLFVLLRLIDESENDPEFDVDGISRFIIDPIGAMGDSLDGDSEVFFIKSDPNNPPFGPQKNFNDSNRSDSNNENQEMQFSFEGICPEINDGEEQEVKAGSSTPNVRTCWDSQKGVVKQPAVNLELMEFLFYRLKISKSEAEFYDQILLQFLSDHSIETDRPDFLDKVIAAVSGIKGATYIKKLFRNSKKVVGGFALTKRDVTNMNTTALCCMHRNSHGMENMVRRMNGGDFNSEVYFIEWKDGLNIPKEHLTGGIPVQFFNNWYDWQPGFPNTMLTSDSYLLTSEEVEEFLKRYKNYWNDYFLLQVPHHGSKNNSSINLFSRLRPETIPFINYGIKHKSVKIWRHPDHATITDLTATGFASSIIPVHEFNGLKFHWRGGV